MAVSYWNGKEWVDLASGQQGPPGPAGNGISSVVMNPDYTLTINFTNGSSYTTPSIRGEQGQQGPTGPAGADGENGVGIVSIDLISGTHAPGTTDTYRITLSDGTHYDFGVYNGADGQGSPGSQMPKHLGTGAIGTANAYAREDHVHPAFVELWANPNPTSAFSEQVVSLDLSGWSWIAIKALTTNNGTQHHVTFIQNDGTDYVITVPNAASSNQYLYKRIVSANGTGVSFSTGYRNTTSSSRTQYCIPIAIYGVC